jgi:hypothetical protein
MVRELRTFQPLDGPATALSAAFCADPAAWLPGEHVPSDDVWVLTAHAGSLTRDVRVEVGQPWHVTRTAWRSIGWEPVADREDPSSVNRMLPVLDGELGLHVDESGRTTLILDAHYLPPGGLLGAAADAVALNRLARQTGQRFLQDVGIGLLHAVSDRDAPQHARSPSRD